MPIHMKLLVSVSATATPCHLSILFFFYWKPNPYKGPVVAWGHAMSAPLPRLAHHYYLCHEDEIYLNVSLSVSDCHLAKHLMTTWCDCSFCLASTLHAADKYH